MLHPGITIVFTLAVGLAGGFLVYSLGVAGGWLLGSLLLVFLVSTLGRPVLLPRWLRSVAMGFAGLTVGAAIDSETTELLSLLPWSLALMFGFLGILVVSTYLMHRRFWGASPATALACAWPGNILLVFVSAESTRANLPLVAVVQLARVLALMCIVPLSVGTFHEMAAYPDVELSWDLAIGVLLALCCILVATRLRLLGGEMFLSAFVIGVLSGVELLHIQVPSQATVFFQVVVGAYVGLEVAKCERRSLIAALVPALASALLAATATALTALALAWLLDYPVIAFLLALAPGGAEAMILLTAEFGLDPGFVGIHHTIRLVALTLAFPLLLGWLMRADHQATGSR